MENKYITVAYKLYAVTDGEKELREEAPASHPFQFISGIGYTLERFEKDLKGEGGIISLIPRNIIMLNDAEGHQFYANVGEITEDKVVLDLNHPHAGKDLIFEGTVMEMRDATNKEMESILKLMSGEGCGCGCDSCGGGCGEHEAEEDGCCGGGCGHWHS